MEISESAWAKAKEIASKIYASYLTSHDPNADAELIARAIDQERRECSEIAYSMVAEIGKEPSSDGDRWSGVVDASDRISQAIRNK